MNKNYSINKLRMNPSELEMDDMIYKGDISNMIRNGEKANNKQFSNWARYDHRSFNTKLWNKANEMLGNIQEENPRTLRKIVIIKIENENWRGNKRRKQLIKTKEK